MPVIINGKQVSPCICSKVRFALGLKHERPSTIKTCSQEYWNNVVEYLGNNQNLSRTKIDSAKSRTDLLL